MKKSFLYMALLSVGVLLQACLDFDDPGSELTTGQTVVGGDEEPSGVLTPSCHINYLDYERDIDFETATQAYETLDAAGYFGYSTSAQYSLRSGKENGTPSSHQYQYNCALNIDNYAGYFVVTHYDFPYANASQTSTYDMHETFNGGARGCYDNAKNILLDLLTRAELNDLPEIKAVNLIYYSLAAQEVADISGPFTYLEDKLKLQNPSTYDPLEIIYDSIVADLDKAVACLKYGAANRSEEYKAMLLAQFGQYPSATEAVRGNTDSFLESVWRLANSIKLRMAMHLVKVDAVPLDLKDLRADLVLHVRCQRHVQRKDLFSVKRRSTAVADTGHFGLERSAQIEEPGGINHFTAGLRRIVETQHGGIGQMLRVECHLKACPGAGHFNDFTQIKPHRTDTSCNMSMAKLPLLMQSP